MSTTKLTAILGLIWLSCATAEFATLLHKHVNGTGHQHTIMKHMPKNRQFFFHGNCTWNEYSRVSDCSIYRESLNGKANGSSCRVPLSRAIIGADSVYPLSFHDFDDDKVIAYWYTIQDEKPAYYLRFTIVQFPNCSSNEARIRYDLSALRNQNFGKSLGTIFPKGDTFTVTIDNSGLFGNKVDEQTFDVRGNMVGNSVSWFKPLTKEAIMIMDNYDTDKNALLELDVQTRQVRFSLLTENGLKVLNLSTFTNYTQYDVSTQYDTLRFCSLVQPSSKVDCNTFKANGQPIGSTTLELNHKANNITVYNLIDGSFFIITTVITKSSATPQSPNASEHVFYINKFTADGKRIAEMELPGSKCNATEAYTIPYENEKNQYCVMRTCTDSFDFDVIIKCFGDEDIK